MAYGRRESVRERAQNKNQTDEKLPGPGRIRPLGVKSRDIKGGPKRYGETKKIGACQKAPAGEEGGGRDKTLGFASSEKEVYTDIRTINISRKRSHTQNSGHTLRRGRRKASGAKEEHFKCVQSGLL